MKIGEAGEAFFIFETDDDVPSDLITSPLLEPTQSPQPSQPADDVHEMDDTSAGTSHQGRSEPEFLDLDAVPQLPLDEPPPSERTAPATDEYFGQKQSSAPGATPASVMGHMRQNATDTEHKDHQGAYFF